MAAHEYCFHGVHVLSDIDLGITHSINTNYRVKNLYIRSQQSPPPRLVQQPAWVSSTHFPSGEPHSVIYCHERAPLLKVPHVGIFRFAGEEIQAWIEPGAIPAPYILGKVFGIWLELSGWPVLHGSCLSLGRTAFGLLGMSGMGKSTLSAALNWDGCPLITDDLIPLVQDGRGYRIYPGLPFSRMWPDTAQRFVGPGYQAHQRVLPQVEKRLIPHEVNGRKRFSDQVQALKALFMLNRVEDQEPSITRLNPAAGLMALIKTSFQPEPVEVLGLQKQRLAFLAEMVEEIAIFDLTYPTGFPHLERVCRIIKDHITQ